MSEFHQGQEVEVTRMTSASRNGKTFARRKAKIVNELRWHQHGGGYFVHSTDNDPTGWTHSNPTGKYTVQFRDGTRAVFNAEHIRAV